MNLINRNDYDDYDDYSYATTVQSTDDWKTVSPSEYDDDDPGYNDKHGETVGYEDASPGSWWGWYHPNPVDLPSSTEHYGDDDDTSTTKVPDLSTDDTVDDDYRDEDDFYRDDDKDEAAYANDDQDDESELTSIYGSNKSPAVWEPQLEQLDTTFAIPQSTPSNNSSSPIHDNPYVPVFAGVSLLTVALFALVRGQQQRGKYQAKSSYGIRRAPPVQRDLGV